MLLHPSLESIYRGNVTISIVGDNACSHAKREEPKSPKAAGLRRCMTAPDLQSRQLLYKSRSAMDTTDDSSFNTICRWDSSPSSPQRRQNKDLPPVLKRSGPATTLKKSTSLSSIPPNGDRPPTYIRRRHHQQYGSNNNKPSAATLLVINEVLNQAMDDMPAGLINPEEEEEEEEDCEIPDEALSF